MKRLPVKPTITIDDLAKIDIRVGTIERVEDVAGSSKLVRMAVDFGDFTRTILVGMKQERDDPAIKRVGEPGDVAQGGGLAGPFG